MAISWNDFDKIWASTSPLTPYNFSEVNYKQGWNFIGVTPPARQMWDSIQKANDEKFKFLRDNFGTPNIVTTASQMTDTSKVYVYMGSEAGWSNGHWYYWNGTTWADGGVYNSVAFVTDSTLSIAGQPADAKAVGDALALKADLAGCTFTGNVNVTADLSVTGASTLTGDVTASADLSVAGDSSLTNLFVSGTTALNGNSTAITQPIDDNSTKIATTEYVQAEIKPIEADVSANDKRISNIEKLLQGNLYDYQTDSTIAYTKTVPAGAMPYAGLEKLGGKTLVWNQLVVMNNGTSVKNGITYTITSDGTVVINGTSTAIADSALTVFSTNLTIGHVYWLRGCPADASASTYYLNTNNGQCYADGLRFTANSSTSRVVHIRVESGVTANNVTFKIQCTDLTLMFGAGNEPTLDECKALFPAESYPYNAGELLSAGVTEVVSKKADTSTIATYPIPAEIQALEGYGWSAGRAYNYVDFERKVFVQNVRRVELGSLEWERYEFDEKTIFCLRNYYLDLFFLNFPTNNEKANIVCKDYITISYDDYYSGGNVGIFAGEIEVGANNPIYGLGVYDTKIQGTTLADFKASLANSYLYYELRTPIETDISVYLSDDNLIEVESGGTLTFPNSNGDNYRIPVPSTEEYMINLQEAVSNG